jgi:endonuclease/exonuclease/phosphatase family metal-dependent hydrolase
MSMIVTHLARGALALVLILGTTAEASGKFFSRPPSPPSQVGQVKVMTMNLFLGSSLDYSLKRPAGYLRAFNPDIVFIQEIDRFATRSGYTDQPAVLASLGGYLYHGFGSGALLEPNGQKGNAILSKYPLREVRLREWNIECSIWGKASCAADVGFLEAIATIHGQDVLLINAHYHHEIKTWPQHSQTFLSEVVIDRARNFPGPVFFGGDLNSDTWDAPVKVIRDEGTLKHSEEQVRGAVRSNADHLFHKSPYVARWYDDTPQWTDSLAHVSDHDIELAYYTLPGVALDLNFGDNALIREQGTNPVYIVQGGARFGVPAVDPLGLEWLGIYDVKTGFMYPTGAPRDGSLIHEAGSPQVYRIHGGDKYNELLAVTSDASHALVGVVPQGTMSAFATGTGSIPRPPGGYLDSTTEVIRGWGLDLNSSNDGLWVRIEIDGKHVQDVWTSEYRSDVNAALGVQGNHGFELTVPSQYRNGTTHSVRAYARDSSDSSPSELFGSPKIFLLGEPPPPYEDPPESVCDLQPWKC